MLSGLDKIGIKKRNNSIVPCDSNRIRSAITKAFSSVEQEYSTYTIDKIVSHVLDKMVTSYMPDFTSVETVQDMVEESLMNNGFQKVAKSYILYRYERSKIRQHTKVPLYIEQLYNDNHKYFNNLLAEFIYYRSYSRWLDTENRRETWVETVQRYMDYMHSNVGNNITDEDYDEIQNAILNHEVMPSMRLLWSSGDAARRDAMAGYNCTFLAITKIKDFSEVLYLSSCGAGVGFSVSQYHTQQLPQIDYQSNSVKDTYIIEDSKEGWGDALTHGMTLWFNGNDVQFDYSKIRSAGVRLKVMGGRASGYAPLKSLLDYTRNKILSKQGRRLSSLDVHDIVCKIGEIVVSGGVRRTALISLSDLDDYLLRDCKNGQFYLTHMHRSFCNNSAIYDRKPTATEFLDEFLALMKSGSGERGIFNRSSAISTAPDRRKGIITSNINNIGSNPCGEIVLNSKQVCNLTEVIARFNDTVESLKRKVHIATILGTYQSILTDFKYISDEWKMNSIKEHLLGVSITGQFDCPLVRDASVLSELKVIAIETNRVYATKLGINESTSITTVKPSGSVSILTDSSAGMHARYAPYYIRRVRISATDSLFKMLRDQKFKCYPEVGQDIESCNTYVLEFPIKSPDNAIYQSTMTAIDQLEHWKCVKINYTEHNPSVTIMINQDEWIEVANWVYSNWDIVGGLSFLPRTDHGYKLAPYEEITKEQYDIMLSEMPHIDFSKLVLYESTDETSGAKEIACSGGHCDIL